MIRRILNSRGVRKFCRSRLALFSLGFIGIYVLIGAAILLFGMVSLEETGERVGPNSSPGFHRKPDAETRLIHIEFYLNLLDRALQRNDPETALSELRLGEKTTISASPDQLTEQVESMYERFEELADHDNLDQASELLPEIEVLEREVASLFEIPSGWKGWVYQFRIFLGTDRQGRSIAIRGIYSIKVAIQIGLITALISVVMGSLLGAAAAFYGGWIDHLVIWLYSTFSSIPNLVLLTVLVYMFTGSAFEGTLIPVYTAFCLTFWIGPCRVIRGETLKIKELEYVQAATALGLNRITILLKHVLPNTAHLMFINFSLLFIGAVKSEVILSFLGLGVKKGPSWGIMISQSAQEVVNGFFWQIGAATVLMFGLVLAFNVLTDSLQDAFDPKHV